MESFVSTGSWSGTVLVRLKNDSSLRYFDCWLQAVAEEGRVAGVSGWARDVTAHYESEIRFNELFESLREGVFFATLDGHILDANPAMMQLLGYSSKEELKQHNLKDLYQNPEDRQAAVLELKSKGSFRDREMQLAPERRERNLLPGIGICRAGHFRAHHAFARHAGGCYRARDHRKEAPSRARIRSPPGSQFPDLIAVFDREGRFTYVSQSVKDVLGGTAEEYIGDTLSSARTAKMSRNWPRCLPA